MTKEQIELWDDVEVEWLFITRDGKVLDVNGEEPKLSLITTPNPLTDKMTPSHTESLVSDE